jgi:nucleoside-diphosphate-sugar epimerase
MLAMLLVNLYFTSDMVVSILGCGWLGSALGKYLAEKGHDVRGSVTKPEKLDVLNSAGITGFLIKLSEQETFDEGSEFWNSDVLIIASNVNLQANTGYLNALSRVAKIIALKKTNRVIVVSSTSIYGDPNNIVDERSVPCPKTPSAARLLEIESIFKHIKETQATIMRCGGLVGPGRMPGSFLAGKQNISNGLAPVNLIHLSDCIGIIECLLNTGSNIDCINAVAPDHPSRQHFYTTAARVQGLQVPEFVLEKNSWKIVHSNFVETLGYHYLVNDWESWLTHPN